MVQFAPAATLEPQVEVTANSALVLIEAIFNSALFVSVTVCGGLVVPTACFLKFRGVVGEKATTPVLSSTVTLEFK